MLNKLIPHIDAGIGELNLFTKIYGLAERISTATETDPQEFPAVFKGAGNYTQIELELLSCYHRMYAERTFSEIPTEDVWGCAKAFEMTYPMVFIGCFKHSPGCEVYETDTVANGVAYNLYQRKFDRDLLKLIKVFSVELFLGSINTNRNEIWDQEYKNIPQAMTFEMIYFSIRYDLKIKGSSHCLNIPVC